ncbi:phosphatidylinositol-specific phospholipase C1-like protein [Tunturiibacter lichenicola]|uniref:phosphatidylinositol-specific phospholipase C1-like protein n=1 Tax=Tunturiibacter lichenicola TaxID=2051959 RepID=UPI0021B411B5|nr:phosphatidylinositol-specific phospholipase C1-like protein [Edaphobacter lichenicola]
MTKLQAALPFFILLPLSAFGQQSDTLKQDQTLRINQIQVIGSHNSYHSGIAPSERKLIEQQNPKAMRALDYAHAPLADQLTGGVRQLEIDIYADSKGGRYSHPAIVSKVTEAGLPPDPDFDPLHEMDKPGFKVMHVLDVDQRSSCHTLIACLTTIRSWSQQHPQHLPIFILVETKQGREGAAPQAHQAEPFTSQTFDALDAEISSVFSANEMITPDQVRGSYDTLPEAIQTISALSPTSKKTGGWPTLANARGKVIFLMDQRPVEQVYTQGHPSLRGRLIFTNAIPGAPDAAFTEENDGTKAEIDALARQGYLIRTRTDDGTEAARTNDHTRADIALSSGAQMLSTDYPSSEPSRWTGFFVGLPHGLVARCNPVTAPPGCVDSLLEPSTK